MSSASASSKPSDSPPPPSSTARQALVWPAGRRRPGESTRSHSSPGSWRRGSPPMWRASSAAACFLLAFELHAAEATGAATRANGPRTSARRSAGATGSSASARASAALRQPALGAQHPERDAALGEGAQQPAGERAPEASSISSSSDARHGRRGRAARRARRRARCRSRRRGRRAPRARRAASSAGTSGAASSTGPSWPCSAAAAAPSVVASKALSGRDGRRPAPRAGGAARRAARGAPVGAEQLVERRVGAARRAAPTTTAATRLSPSEKCVPTGSGRPPSTRGTAAASVRANVSVLASTSRIELLDRRRLLGLDAVGVVGRVAEQRVGHLRLAREDGLGPGGLRDRGHARPARACGSRCAC